MKRGYQRSAKYNICTNTFPIPFAGLFMVYYERKLFHSFVREARYKIRGSEVVLLERPPLFCNLVIEEYYE